MGAEAEVMHHVQKKPNWDSVVNSNKEKHIGIDETSTHLYNMK